MALNISYMGTKRTFAPEVAELLIQNSDGPVLDVFAGLCAIGQAVETTLPVWNNDVQIFANNYASSLFCSQAGPQKYDKISDSFEYHYRKNNNFLSNRFHNELAFESDAIDSLDITKTINSNSNIKYVGNSNTLEKERCLLVDDPTTFPFRLFSITYAGGYFGIEQAIQIDSIKYAIHALLAENAITYEDSRWFNLALCGALSKCSVTTGHFAQYLKPKSESLPKYLKIRKRSPLHIWIDTIADMKPLGTPDWRSKNKVYHHDAVELLQHFATSNAAPGIIYADPPYTADQYSRYYHLLETALTYDYPIATGVGRYCDGRFRSSFSLKSEVFEVFSRFLSAASKLNVPFVLSYPNNGLLIKMGYDIRTVLSKYFHNVEVAYVQDHFHSTLGASKGIEKQQVIEYVYFAR